MAAKAKYEYAPCLDKVAEKSREITQFFEDNKLVFDRMNVLLSELDVLNSEAKTELLERIKDPDCTTRNFESKEGEVGLTVQSVHPYQGADLMREHAKTILETCPLAVKVTKSELYKVATRETLRAKGVDVDRYLSPLTEDKPVLTNKDKMIKVIAETMGAIADALGIARPESEYTLEQWYTVLEDIKEATH